MSKKLKLKFENYKNWLGKTLDNKTNYLEKNIINVNSFFCFQGKDKEFIRNNKLVLKTQQKL